MLRYTCCVLAAMSWLTCSSVTLATPLRQVREEGEADMHRHLNDSAGYVRPSLNSFLVAAQKANTDKVSTHNYHTLYGKHFQRMNGRRHLKKMLEIGLGCDMGYGPGHSSRLWRKYFPQAEIWQADCDVKCVNTHQGILDALEINALTGDQANVTTLRGWVQKSGGNFDYIIEDGGHHSMQMFHSLIVLFEEALKPGGVFFLEDINTMLLQQYQDDGQHNMLDIIKDWILLLIAPAFDPRATMPLPRFGDTYQPKWPLPPGLKIIECALNMCAFTKCYSDDPLCPVGVMRKYNLNADGVMAASWQDPPLIALPSV